VQAFADSGKRRRIPYLQLSNIFAMSMKLISQANAQRISALLSSLIQSATQTAEAACCARKPARQERYREREKLFIILTRACVLNAENVSKSATLTRWCYHEKN